jgi:hypothetical protein
LAFYGVDLRYIMMVCLGITVVTDIVALRGHPVFTLIPLGLGFIYHLQHGNLKAAVIAFLLPFPLYIIRFVTGRIKLYDLLDHSMIGVIMGWPFGLVNIIASKLIFALIGGTWLVRFFGRNRGEGQYAFPYVPVIAAGALATYYLFKMFPQGERMLRAISP